MKFSIGSQKYEFDDERQIHVLNENTIVTTTIGDSGEKELVALPNPFGSVPVPLAADWLHADVVKKVND